MVISSPAAHVCGRKSGCCVTRVNVLDYERKTNDQGINIVKSTEPVEILDYNDDIYLLLGTHI